MVKLTQSMQEWLSRNHPDLIGLIMLGHTELMTSEMRMKYFEWCDTEEGRRYLVGGDLYKEEYE